MSDYGTETQDSSDGRSLSNGEKPVENIGSIQQGLDDYQLWKEKHLAHEEHDLEQDLKKFNERPKPAYYEGDGLKAETEAQMADAKAQADQHAIAALEKMQQQDSRLVEPIKAMQDHEAPPFYTLDAMEGFKQPPEVRVAEEGEILNRYVGPEQKREGHWMTKDHYRFPGDAVEKLALDDHNPASAEVQLQLDKGAIYLEGEAGKRYGRKGGGHQVYVIDKNAIHEV